MSEEEREDLADLEDLMYFRLRSRVSIENLRELRCL